MKKYISSVLFAGLMIFAFNFRPETSGTMHAKAPTGRLIYLKNNDFNIGSGDIQICRRNLQTASFVLFPEISLEWISPKNCISFIQQGIKITEGDLVETSQEIEQIQLNNAEGEETQLLQKQQPLYSAPASITNESPFANKAGKDSITTKSCSRLKENSSANSGKASRIKKKYNPGAWIL